MPLSPDGVVATVLAPATPRWQPQELSAGEQTAPSARYVHNDPTRLGRFEVSPTSGIPEALLAPARAAAESAGYVAGWNEGNRAAQDAMAAQLHSMRVQEDARTARADDEVRRAVGALHAAAHALERRAVPAAEQVEHLILTSAFQIAEALVGVALADDGLRGRAAVSRALALAPNNERVSVAVSPADHALLVDTDFGREVQLSIDPDLAPGDAVATSDATTIDARLSAAVVRVQAVLGGRA